MGTGEVIGAAIGTGITLAVVDKYLLGEHHKKKKSKKEDNIFNI
jgi:hypothetical protein